MSKSVALVTGASSGIGKATALRLAALGFTVYAAARRVERMSDLADHGIHVESLDVTDDGSMVTVVDKIVSEHGRIDILVNNAGYGSYGAVEDVPIAEARRQFDVNVFGLARLTQLVLPHMRAQRDGYIVNISSMGGKIWEPLGGWYHAAKFAVEGFERLPARRSRRIRDQGRRSRTGSITSEWATISADNLEAISADTPYGGQAKLIARGLRKSDTSFLASEPEVVAEAIGKAVQRTKPRTRYPVGGGARTFLFAHRVLTDRGFDRFIRLAYRTAGRL